MIAEDEPAPRANRLLIAICAALLIGVIGQHLVILSSIPLYYQRVTHGTVPTVIIAGREQMSDDLIASRAAVRGLSRQAYARYFLTLNLVVAAGFWGAAALVLWKARRDWFHWFTALVLVFFPGGTLWQITLVTQVAYAFLSFGSVLWPMYLLFLYLFPNGRAVPRWSRWPMAAYALMHFALQLAAALANLPGMQFSLAPWLDRLAPVILLAFPFVVGCQVYRYLRVAGPVERKQIQWFVAGIALYVACSLVIAVTATHGVTLFEDIGFAGDLGNGLALIIPAAITISILRYRLWDIDVIIRRTLIYSVLSALLALAYFGSIVVLGGLFRTFTGQGQNQFVTVVSTLAIAALFVPLRGRVQAFIDRRFYRRKYDAARILAAFGASVRDDVDLDDLTERLIAVADETLKPASVGVWLKAGQGGREARQ